MELTLNPKYIEIGVCGLSCRLCPSYNSKAESRCGGCKSAQRMKVGCPFITCAVKKKELDFCWQCSESKTCEKWLSHRDASKTGDSFKCYQTLEADIAFILQHGIDAFWHQQEERVLILRAMLDEFNEGRSKSYYCIAVTVIDIGELRQALMAAREQAKDLSIKQKAKFLHAQLDAIAKEKGYLLKLRKK
jgi:hypothetical protein